MREGSIYCIHPSGGLLSTQFIEKLRQKESTEKYANANTFSIRGERPPTPGDLEKKIIDAWKILLDRWYKVSIEIGKYDISTARRKWILPLLEELDYSPQYLKKDTLVSEEKEVKVSLSHRGGDWAHAPIVHTVAPSQKLDEKIAKGRGIKSPHDSLQIYLNESKDDLWGIITNGKVLRVLRKYHHTYTKGYIEFDLEGIFEERSFSDFLALYRLIHPSRFIPDEEGKPPLEHFYEISLAAGEKIGDDLRENVKAAIEVLGNGFLTKDIIDRMIENPDECHAYYQEILHIVYRIMFLMFAEQRGMLPTRDSLYAESYSMTKLRERTEKAKRRDRHHDIWKGLLVTFDMIKKGVDDPKIGIFGYNGSLFDDEKIARLRHLNCENTSILEAIRYLTYFESEKTLQRISYVDMGVEEIGSIYESLLDYTPRILEEDLLLDGTTYMAGTFFLDPRGATRKSTGSYYTDPMLVNELIQSALKPVLQERLAEKESGENKVAALLSIKVCDPACGSGAFLIAATNFLGKELATIRTDTEYPSDEAGEIARRDVLQHCIYGVDLNPMAVELVKVSLWINACVKDKPLNFLDHHIKCGNSLVGTTPELMGRGIPADAYSLKGLKGDRKELVKQIRKKNQQRQRSLDDISWRDGASREKMPEKFKDLSDMPETNAAEVERKKREYEEFISSDEYVNEGSLSDAWTAAFFWRIDEITNEADALIHADLHNLKDYGWNSINPDKRARIQELASEYKFFHWHMEFPDVFSRDDHGFDCVLGNPPWERIKLQEKEFFATRDPEIVNARTADIRRKIITKLPQTNPALHADYIAAMRESESTSHFLRASSRFPRTSGGDINTYAVFAGLARQTISPKGRAGIIVPTGIATDYTYRDFFADVVESRQLASLYDFENRRKLFPAVHSSMKFSLLTISGSECPSPEAEFAFFLHHTDDLADPDRRFPLSQEDLALINPNTHTVPVFRSRRDAELTRKLYHTAPVLVNKEKGENPWGVSLGTMFHSGSASGLFRAYDKLTTKGLEIGFGNRIEGEGELYLPLYEGKMFMQYDHRAAQVTVKAKNIKRAAVADESSTEQKRDPYYSPMPQFWVRLDQVHAAIPSELEYFIVFKKVTSSTNERTLLATILPSVAANDSIHLVFFHTETASQKKVAFLANLNTLTLDFVSRQKLGGQNFNFWVFQQLPIIPPDRYTPELLDFIVPRVVELTYTAWDMQPFAQDILSEVGQEAWDRWFADAPIHDSTPPAGQPAMPAPFVWDEERRARLRAELDAVYAHLYGLTREELAYILDTFPIVRRKDEKQWGEYRTKNLILERYDIYMGKFEVEQ